MTSMGGDTPEEQIRTTLVLSLLTAAVSFALAIALYVSFLGADAPRLIYITAAFLLAMSGWQFSNCFINLKLRKKFRKRRDSGVGEYQTEQPQFDLIKTKELLNEADFTDVVPTRITENTTEILSEKINRKSS